ncbi:hypothetical protein DKZ96_01570 [Shigella sonnei]|nr:hypothetical protein B9127_17040 [Shigella sonnei]EAC0859267.1 hypothetical protein [Escherichia coli]EFW1015252.1 hypothetical protein [Shigella flexneri]ASN31963.1 hypothetical protein B9130_20515 [Shigella sonnei]ASN35569.1 hypothetical protein B9129_15630 [Shigella sonnei]
MQELAISSAGGGGTSVYIAMTIYILSLGHRHIKPCPNPDVKKPTLRRFFYSSALSWWLWLE